MRRRRTTAECPSYAQLVLGGCSHSSGSECREILHDDQKPPILDGRGCHRYVWNIVGSWSQLKVQLVD
eukprot:1768347-Pleurochrysis_carterae.AAC.1